MLADAAAAALLAVVAQPPVRAIAAAAALLALVALPPVLAKHATAALLAPAALPPVRTGHLALARLFPQLPRSARSPCLALGVRYRSLSDIPWGIYITERLFNCFFASLLFMCFTCPFLCTLYFAKVL